MSRTQAVLPGGPRLSDYLSIGDFINLSGGSGATGTIIDEDVTALTAEFRSMPSSHEGEDEDFSFQLKFNQKVTTSTE